MELLIVTHEGDTEDLYSSEGMVVTYLLGTDCH
jgi:hypothetical protein